MKNDKHSVNKVYWKGPWTVMSFPRHNCSLVYNDEHKKYTFHNGAMLPKKTPATPTPISESTKNWKQLHMRYFVAVLFAIALGISLAVNLILILTQ